MLAGSLLGPSSSWCETGWRETGKSGIAGVVLQVGRAGPTRINDQPKYYKGPLEIIRISDGQLAGTTSSDEDGKFSISLPPGKYFITQTNRNYSKVRSKPITVENGNLHL